MGRHHKKDKEKEKEEEEVEVVEPEDEGDAKKKKKKKKHHKHHKDEENEDKQEELPPAEEEEPSKEDKKKKHKHKHKKKHRDDEEEAENNEPDDVEVEELAKLKTNSTPGTPPLYNNRPIGQQGMPLPDQNALYGQPEAGYPQQSIKPTGYPYGPGNPVVAGPTIQPIRPGDQQPQAGFPPNPPPGYRGPWPPPPPPGYLGPWPPPPPPSNWKPQAPAPVTNDPYPPPRPGMPAYPMDIQLQPQYAPPQNNNYGPPKPASIQPAKGAVVTPRDVHLESDFVMPSGGSNNRRSPAWNHPMASPLPALPDNDEDLIDYDEDNPDWKPQRNQQYQFQQPPPGHWPPPPPAPQNANQWPPPPPNAPVSNQNNWPPPQQQNFQGPPQNTNRQQPPPPQQQQQQNPNKNNNWPPQNQHQWGHPQPKGAIAPPQVVIIRFDEIPVAMNCPNCNEKILTETQSKFSGTAIGVCVALLFLFPPFFWIPLVMESCRDIRHVCPKCQHILGTKKATPCKSNKE